LGPPPLLCMWQAHLRAQELAEIHPKELVGRRNVMRTRQGKRSGLRRDKVWAPYVIGMA
jgi:hypothetical protein